MDDQTLELNTERDNRIENLQNKELIFKITNELKQSIGENLSKVILYGSRARGDCYPDSDFDILIVVNTILPEMRKKISTIGGNYLYEYSLLFPVMILTEKRFQEDIYEPFLKNIQKEGIIIWKR